MRRKFVAAMLLVVVLAAGCIGIEETMTEPEPAGGMAVDQVTANLTLPSDTGAVYMRITNHGDVDDALIDAALDGCGAVELHEMINDNDTMMMRQVEGNRIPVPAGATVMLQRGGLHIMCIGKTGEFTIGQSVPVVLTFEKAGPVEVMADVLDPAELGMEAGGMGTDETP
ncbi:MAG: copper chaperone PCu(A)C [Candidatus Promineofilum sp.]|nr:copper chaperone PCu(A)C [Promineifilum sp.]